MGTGSDRTDSQAGGAQAERCEQCGQSGIARVHVSWGVEMGFGLAGDWGGILLCFSYLFQYLRKAKG